MLDKNNVDYFIDNLDKFSKIYEQRVTINSSDFIQSIYILISFINLYFILKINSSL